MDEKGKALEAGITTPGQDGMASRSQSPTGSTSSEVDYDKITVPGHHISRTSPQKEESKDKEEAFIDKYDPDEIDHGEPDLEYEDAEDAVPGRNLDRQLSKVGAPLSVSQCKHCSKQN